jgi:hypothetical protein
VLDQLEPADDMGDPVEVSGPRWLLMDLVSGTAIEAASGLADAVAHYQASPGSQRELREVARTATACVERLLNCHSDADGHQRT